MNYGDRVNLQVNNSDHRWLSGGRLFNNRRGRKVNTQDLITDNKPAMYRWTIRSEFGDGERSYIDPKAP